MTKSVLITGANKGIGFETAKQMGKKGWTVLIGARNEGRGKEAVHRLQAEGITAQWLRIDLNDTSSIHEAARYLAEHYPKLDGLINNAGISGNMQRNPLELASSELEELAKVNFLGNFEMIKSFTPLLSRNHGRILNVTIPSTPIGSFNPLGYLASKASLNSMIKSFAMYYKKHEISVEIFGVILGGISTDLNKHQSGLLIRTVQEGGGSIAKAMMDRHHHQGKIIIRMGLTQLVRNFIFRKHN
ncbi:SDR family NAD(P)-dependent oxidoreductase [Oenococcus sicerae]|uniref:SDR family NAD(P)-dependent oxidoreductase n=1 Tax=Oenococcus sicerae TaxID=2203724 RepID=A0ABX5QKM7_9LACO|nr:SDR family NAD(P)-dependent oxidoreductase [Oenococcus sicerae]QAS69316.1 SDR family NAD(P)-dependent oxidoreductase [Oenococcus sicerae]